MIQTRHLFKHLKVSTIVDLVFEIKKVLQQDWFPLRTLHQNNPQPGNPAKRLVILMPVFSLNSMEVVQKQTHYKLYELNIISTQMFSPYLLLQGNLNVPIRNLLLIALHHFLKPKQKSIKHLPLEQQKSLL